MCNQLALLREKYNHALDRIYELHKFSVGREEKLEKALEMARDELERIRACPGADDEIKQLCDRGLVDSRV